MNSPRPHVTQPRDGTLVALLRVTLAAAAVAIVLVALATTRADVDLWGHIRFGTDIIESGRIDDVDPYSFTSDRLWVNHEWLAEVLVATAWRMAGNAGLIALKLACALGAIGFLHLRLREARVPAPVEIMLLGLALVGTLPRITHVRPQIFSVLLFGALIYILARAEHGPRIRLAWTIPLLALWANLHGGWIVGLATVGVWTLGDAWQRRADGWKAFTVIAFAAAAALATLVSPYSTGLWAFLFETVRFGREAISEWGPAWEDPAVLLVWMMFFGLTVGAIARGGRPQNPATLIIPAMWGLAALRVSRLDAFFALSVVGLLGPHLVWLFGARRVARPAPVSMPLRTVAIAIVLAAVLIIPPARRAFTCVDVHAPWWPEPEATAFIQQRALSGRVVTFFRWGEYGIWHLPTSLKVSMDGRRETVYSDATISGHLRLYEGHQDGLAYLDRIQADYVWLPRQLPVSAALRTRGWIPLFQGPHSVLLARPNRAPAESADLATSTRKPESRCFPGP
jgi:NADH:ubiquinone oxidoreductase subunit K